MDFKKNRLIGLIGFTGYNSVVTLNLFKYGRHEIIDHQTKQYKYCSSMDIL